MSYIVFDTETSGLEPLTNNLLTASFIVLDSQLNEVDRLNVFIKHKKYVTNELSMTINKIDLEKHHKDPNSVTPDKAKEIIINFMKKWPNCVNVGHSVNFDISFLKDFLSSSAYSRVFSYVIIDTLYLANFFKLAKKLPHNQSCSLVKLTEYFGIVNQNISLRHTAEYDCEMTVELLKKFLSLY